MQRLKQKLFITFLVLFLVNPVLVSAQGATNASTNANTNTSKTTYAGMEVPKYGGVQDSIAQFLCTPNEGQADGKDLERCINKMYRFGISFGGIALVFFLVFAGYMYIMGGESGKTKAKGIVQNSLVGMAILLGAYILLGFINPNLLIFKPIQPPIFNAGNLPRCDAVGFGEQCTLPSGGTGVGNGQGGGNPAGDGSIAGKKFVLVGDSLTPKFIGPLNGFITDGKGTLVAYSIGGTTVSDWVNGGVKKPGLYNNHSVQKQGPNSPTTKMSDIIQKENPDVVIIVLNTNADTAYKTSIPALVSQTGGKATYWIGTPQYEACTKVDDSYIKGANATAASAVGKNFYDTYKNLPGLNKGCDVHNQDSKTWSNAFWEFYKKGGK